MLFSPPRVTNDALIVTLPPDDRIIKFSTYKECYQYVHKHLNDLMVLAWNTYPESINVENIYCRLEK